MSVVLKNSISRRKAIGGMAAATAATVGLPGMARAIGGTGDLRVFRGRYVFHGDRMIDGYMVAPRGLKHNVGFDAQFPQLLCHDEAHWLTGNVLGVDGGEDIVG